MVGETRPFEFDAHKYRQASTRQKEWGTRLIAELSLRGNERILDLGCGDGVVTAKLAELVPGGQVVGIDSSQNMIAATLAMAGDRLSFRRLDINELDYADAFDLVFSNATLHWVQDHHRLLNNVHRALSPGGACRFNFAADGNCSHFNGVVRELIRNPRYERFFRDFRWPWFMPALDDYETLFVGGPFADHHIWGEKADRHFADAEAMTAWLDQPSLVPFLRQIDGQSSRHFVTRLWRGCLSSRYRRMARNSRPSEESMSSRGSREKQNAAWRPKPCVPPENGPRAQQPRARRFRIHRPRCLGLATKTGLMALAGVVPPFRPSTLSSVCRLHVPKSRASFASA